MKKLLVTEMQRTKRRQQRRWTVHFADTGQQIVSPCAQPEYHACVAFYLGIFTGFYEGPVAFYSPGENVPYLVIPSPCRVGADDASKMTPKEMFGLLEDEPIHIHSDARSS